MIVGQKIEIKANNKFYTYCRKAFGVYRLAYNYCVERFIKYHADYCAAMELYTKKLL